MQRMQRIVMLLFAAGLLAGGAGGLGAADVGFFGVIKSQMYWQSGDTAPAIRGSNGYLLAAFVLPQTPGAVTNAAFTPPGRPARPLLFETNSTAWRFEYATNTQAALDALFPSPSFGNAAPYTFAMHTVSDGARTASVTLPNLLGAPIQPPLVTLQDVAALQAVDTTRDLTLRWSAPGANALQLVQVVIMDGASNLLFATPGPFAEGALTGVSNTVVVPADTLPPATAAELHVTIAQPGLPNTNDYPGAVGIGAFAKDTAAPLLTRPAPAPPWLSLLAGPGDALRVLVHAESNRLCHLERSPDLAAWTNVLTTNTTGPALEYREPDPRAAARAFYRARLGQ